MRVEEALHKEMLNFIRSKTHVTLSVRSKWTTFFPSLQLISDIRFNWLHIDLIDFGDVPSQVEVSSPFTSEFTIKSCILFLSHVSNLISLFSYVPTGALITPCLGNRSAKRITTIRFYPLPCRRGTLSPTWPLRSPVWLCARIARADSDAGNSMLTCHGRMMTDFCYWRWKVFAKDRRIAEASTSNRRKKEVWPEWPEWKPATGFFIATAWIWPLSISTR